MKLRKRYRESRILEVSDVQLFSKLYEDAPVEMRSRMWAVFLQDQELLNCDGTSNLQSQIEEIWSKMQTLVWPLAAMADLKKHYETLTQISLGQEEVDEAILRDIDRTFPEYVQFQEFEGQRKLFDVLKAYSVTDLEVEYCQGMAFPAGLALMFLPEEMAFQMFTFLMGPSGCNMRSLYLPGLVGMQRELQDLEHHIKVLNPSLHKHFQEYCVSAVLYASSWFLTLYANTFPVTFSARIVDVMLSERSHSMLMRIAVTILSLCEQDILDLTDLEDIVNFIKMQPALWNSEKHRYAVNRAVDLKLADLPASKTKQVIDLEENEELKVMREEVGDEPDRAVRAASPDLIDLG